MKSLFEQRKPKDEMKKVFAFFDEEGAGKITAKNLKKIIKQLGENITDDEIQEMIE